MISRKNFARGLVLAALVALPAATGPVEDGEAAYAKGDYKTASEIFAAAASQGDDKARAHLGTMFAYGLGVPADPAQALFWLSLAAEHNNAEADAMLGKLYGDGKIFKQDWATAFKFYERAAQQGDPNSEAAMGAMYLYGHPGVVTVDYDKAGAWLNRAAAQNNAEAQYMLGFMFYTGLGVKQDFAASVQWFQKAADQGNGATATFLAVQYDQAQGVPQSYDLAVHYLTMASLQGNLQGLGLLGQKFLEGGKGVSADPVRAYVLLSIAAAQTGSALAKQAVAARDNARSKLDAGQLEAAQRLAAHCTSTNNYVACLDNGRTVLAAAGDPKPSEDSFAKAMQQRAGATASAAKSGAPQMIGNGTGFFVSPDGDLVTAGHVANECPDMRVMNIHLKLVAKDTASDLALLSTGEKSPAFVKMRGQRGPVVGEPIVSVGFPLQGTLGEDRIVTTGVVSSLAGLGNDRRDLQISAPIQPGNSGGPVLGEDGALLGVAVGSISTLQAAQNIGGAVPQNANFAVSTGTLQSFLSAHNAAYVQTNGSEPKKNSAEIAAQASRFTVMVECWK